MKRTSAQCCCWGLYFFIGEYSAIFWGCLIRFMFFGGRTAFIGWVLLSGGIILLYFSLSIFSTIRGHLCSCPVIFSVWMFALLILEFPHLFIEQPTPITSQEPCFPSLSSPIFLFAFHGLSLWVKVDHSPAQVCKFIISWPWHQPDTSHSGTHF